MKKNIFLVFLICFFTACGPMAMKNSELYYLPEACDFDKVKNNKVDEFECTPRLKDDFTDDIHADDSNNEFVGLLINAPSQVIWPKGKTPDDFDIDVFGRREGPLRLMISGLLNLPKTLLTKLNADSYSVVVVASDQLNAKVFSGKMVRFGEAHKPQKQGLVIDLNSRSGLAKAKPALSQKDNDTLVESYFNIDLVENLRIPISSGKYSVYATLGEYKSNVVEVEVLIK